MIENIVPEEIRNARKAVHGGEVWSVFDGDVKDVLDFSSNVNPFGPSKKALRAVRDSLWKIKYYPDDESMELKRALADYLGVDENNLLMGNGSTEVIKIFCDVFIEKGDDVIIVEPTFSEYEALCSLRGAKIRHIYSRREDGFARPHSKIIEGINENTRALFLCSPNNPTGKIMDKRHLEEIVSKASNYWCLVFLDEAYIEFTDSPGFSKIAVDAENLFVLRSITKFFSLPGLRLGYGVASEGVIRLLEKARPSWNVNVLAQAAAVASLSDRNFMQRSRERIKRERIFLKKNLEKLGIKVYDSETNFLLLDLREKKVKARDLKSNLIEKNILIRDCSSFNGLDEYFVRVSVQRRSENTTLIKRLKEVLEAA